MCLREVANVPVANPEVRPGIEAPLGWSLSAAARDDLQLQLGSSHNTAALCAASYWLTGSTNNGRACDEQAQPEYTPGGSIELATEFWPTKYAALLSPLLLGLLALVFRRSLQRFAFSHLLGRVRSIELEIDVHICQ